jgi:hypothetical protein
MVGPMTNMSMGMMAQLLPFAYNPVWRRPVQSFDLAFVGFAAFIAVSAYRKGPARSVYTVAEFTLIMLGRVLSMQLTFSSYFSAKMIQSTVFFLSRSHTGMQRLRYHLGFPSDRMHAGITYHDTFYHYAFGRGTHATTQNVDAATKLEPAALEGSVGDNALLSAYCGYAYPRIARDHIIKVLESCGKCHNWALITIYEIATDKFFSMAILSFARWDVWVLLVIALLGCTAPCTGDLVDTGFLLIAAWDSLNMNRDQLVRNEIHRRADSKGGTRLRDFLKFVVLMSVWYAYIYYITIDPLYQFLLSIFAAATVTAVVCGLMR